VTGKATIPRTLALQRAMLGLPFRASSDTSIRLEGNCWTPALGWQADTREKLCTGGQDACSPYGAPRKGRAEQGQAGPQ
jgi:hypothetical protein